MSVALTRIDNHAQTLVLSDLALNHSPYQAPGMQTEAPVTTEDMEYQLTEAELMPTLDQRLAGVPGGAIAREEVLHPANLGDIGRMTDFEAEIEDGIPEAGEEYLCQSENGAQLRILLTETITEPYNGGTRTIVRGTIAST